MIGHGEIADTHATTRTLKASIQVGKDNDPIVR
jgi:hypothetical protein